MAQEGKRRGPLTGIRVLDLTRVLAGPFCTMILGDLGAEVIKVEKINGGDQTRNIPPHVNGESHYFLAINRGKRSLALDARKPEGRAVLMDLVRGCDVLVENFRPGVMERLGLGETALRAANPRLVIYSISGYGQKTSFSEKPSFENAAIQPAPLLGKHTEQILTDLLGYDRAKVEALGRSGAVLFASEQRA